MGIATSGAVIAPERLHMSVTRGPEVRRRVGEQAQKHSCALGWFAQCQLWAELVSAANHVTFHARSLAIA